MPGGKDQLQGRVSLPQSLIDIQYLGILPLMGTPGKKDGAAGRWIWDEDLDRFTKKEEA